MSITLRIALEPTQAIVRNLQADPSWTIGETCNQIRDQLLSDFPAGLSPQINPSEFGIFNPSLGKWLATTKQLEFYQLPTGVVLLFRKKIRPLRVRLMDDTIKTVLVDDSCVISELIASICHRFGISKPEEYAVQSEYLNSMEAELAAAAKPHDQKHSNGGSNINNLGRNPVAEEGKWLNGDKTLTEHGVPETDVLLLKKKFFYSDQNIDRSDPIQLNLVYVQSRDSIVTGKTPCTLQEAIQLAAIQVQVQHGNHEPAKHKTGFLDLKQFMPAEYLKDKKAAEKQIFAEHKKLYGMNELNAKYRYTQTCIGLRSYGVTFYAVKERDEKSKKEKRIPVLLGIARDSVIRMDAQTKEIIKVWPLVNVRRWYAAPDKFTLDLGDYAESYYVVETKEGDAISQQVSGYIDIIMKRRKEADSRSRGSLHRSMVSLSAAQLNGALPNNTPARPTSIGRTMY